MFFVFLFINPFKFVVVVVVDVFYSGFIRNERMPSIWCLPSVTAMIFEGKFQDVR